MPRFTIFRANTLLTLLRQLFFRMVAEMQVQFVQLQFAGQGGFEHKTSQGGQTAANTVVVGQKVHAIVETSSKISLYNTYGVEWTHPSGGNAIRNYISEDYEGRVVELSEVYFNNGAGSGSYYTDNFVFYYSSNNYNYQQYSPTANSGGLTAMFDLVDDNGNFYYGMTASTSYYIDTPTVSSYSAQWASWSDPNEKPVGVRPYKVNGLDYLVLGGHPENQNFSPGIKWTANVAASSVIGGGEIAYTQQTSTVAKRYEDGIAVQKIEADGRWMLDTSFLYPVSDLESVPVNITLVSDDSPGVLLETFRIKQPLSYPLKFQFFDKYERTDKFSTYLIYKPEGTNSIWVTLSVIHWGWTGTAEFNSSTIDFEYTSGYEFYWGNTVGGVGTATSFLPEWDKNVANFSNWIDI